MKIEFDKSFLKSLDIINDNKLLNKIESTIISLENAKSINDISNIKKLIGFKNYYRIRIGDYRLGCELIEEQILRLIIISHRKNIYKKFP
jgi:mRNA interferase RelE/StbE